jgi:hypothetical protein
MCFQYSSSRAAASSSQQPAPAGSSRQQQQAAGAGSSSKKLRRAAEGRRRQLIRSFYFSMRPLTGGIYIYIYIYIYMNTYTYMTPARDPKQKNKRSQSFIKMHKSLRRQTLVLFWRAAEGCHLGADCSLFPPAGGRRPPQYSYMILRCSRQQNTPVSTCIVYMLNPFLAHICNFVIAFCFSPLLLYGPPLAGINSSIYIYIDCVYIHIYRRHPPLGPTFFNISPS